MNHLTGLQARIDLTDTPCTVPLVLLQLDGGDGLVPEDQLQGLERGGGGGRLLGDCSNLDVGLVLGHIAWKKTLQVT